MTRITNNPLLKSASGMLGDTHYYRMWRGRMLMCKRPKPRESLSPLQKKTVSRFTLATKYAAGQMKDADAKAAYQERTNYRYHSAYLVALNDYLNPPRIDEIRTLDYRGVVGDLILVSAHDDFSVVRVIVVVMDSDGAIIEEGDATQSPQRPDHWEYLATAANDRVKGTRIKAMAYDKPRNVVVAEVVCIR